MTSGPNLFTQNSRYYGNYPKISFFFQKKKKLKFAVVKKMAISPIKLFCRELLTLLASAGKLLRYYKNCPKEKSHVDQFQ